MNFLPARLEGFSLKSIGLTSAKHLQILAACLIVAKWTGLRRSCMAGAQPLGCAPTRRRQWSNEEQGHAVGGKHSTANNASPRPQHNSHPVMLFLPLPPNSWVTSRPASSCHLRIYWNHQLGNCFHLSPFGSLFPGPHVSFPFGGAHLSAYSPLSKQNTPECES